MLASGCSAGSVVARSRYARRKSCAALLEIGVVLWIVVQGSGFGPLWCVAISVGLLAEAKM